MKLFILLIFPILLFASLKSEYLEMSQKQKQLLQNSYNHGKPFNMGYSLAAIAWQESEAGLININIFDPSCGPFHNNINSVMARHDYKDTKYQRNIVCQYLISNFSFAASEALAELEYWYSVHNGQWNLIWASYNAGWNHQNGKKYAEEIKQKIIFLKKIIK